MLRSAPAVLLALVVSGGLHPRLATAAGPYDDLLSVVPPQANCLVLVDVKAAFDSRLAQAENWGADSASRYKSGVGFLPPGTTRLVSAAQINLSAMTRDSQVGLVTGGLPPSMKGLAEREGGVTTDLAERTVCLSPRNAYFAVVKPAVVAAVYPADRQATARWLRHAAAATEPALGPYLKAAAAAAGKHTVTVAVDLADSIDPLLFKMSLAASPVMVRHKGLNPDLLARQVAAVRGLTFTADIGDAVAGAVRFDFAYDPSPYKGILRDLFLELLAEQGAIIPGIEKWEATFAGNAMTLAGPLSGADLRPVLSLFAFPAAGEETPAPAADKVSVAATRQYLRAVEAVLDDLRKVKDDKGYEKTATWHEKAAAQIEQLNRRGVDPAAVTAAEAAATRVRAIAGSLRGVPIDADALGKTAYAYGGRVGGPFAAWNPFASTIVQTNLPEVQAKIAKVVEDDKQRRAELWAQIDQAISAARNALREKYKEKF